MYQSNDFPPIPKCFSHLVVVNVSDASDGEQTHNYNNVNNIRLNLETIALPSNNNDSISLPLSTRDTNNTLNDSKSLEGSSKSNKRDNHLQHYYLTKPKGMSSISSLKESYSGSSGELKDKTTTVSSSRFDPKKSGDQQSSLDNDEYKNPYLKLNCSLMKLQKEMKDLRFLDVSLFCQLVSLHEAIQDLKLTMSDRFSETGSEFSLGSASYMGSMSSLNEDSDWGEDSSIFQSPNVFDPQEDSEFDPTLNENEQSATSLLKQITDLALRADEDF
ncbi:unnamed protein product [Lymnaea stagnalis]|uniref:Uncharacterized protein n=1 Tax=Lymnaea stagnalis TaxID=6523 RepID=A0AAV2HSM7_LYMST